MSDICKRCNGTGRMEKCLRCGREYRHIHKYSDCDGPDCDGESAKTILCSDCAGTGKKAEPAADPLSDAVIAEGLRLASTGWCADPPFCSDALHAHAAKHYPAALRELQALRAAAQIWAACEVQQAREVQSLRAEVERLKQEIAQYHPREEIS